MGNSINFLMNPCHHINTDEIVILFFRDTISSIFIISW
jgi:hypothetical protein